MGFLQVGALGEAHYQGSPMGPPMTPSWQLAAGPAGLAPPSLAAVCEKALL